jgi:hypothetical protein
MVMPMTAGGLADAPARQPPQEMPGDSACTDRWLNWQGDSGNDCI